jgi:hypothetical protein
MITTGKRNLSGGILKAIEKVPAEISLGSGRCPVFASFANHVSCKHCKALLSIPFTDGAKSVAAKAKNNYLVEEISSCRKDNSNVDFSPTAASSGPKSCLKCLQPRDYEAVTVTLPHL